MATTTCPVVLAGSETGSAITCGHPTPCSKHEPEVEMVSVPRALLREIRCDLLLAYTGPGATLDPEVTRMLRKDREALLPYVPYRFDSKDSL